MANTLEQVQNIGAIPTGRPRWQTGAGIPASSLGDSIFSTLTLVAALLIVSLLGGFVFVLLRGAHDSIAAFGIGFFYTTDWDPGREIFGALPFIYGTLVSSALALLIAVPPSLGVAIFLSELAPYWLSRRVGFLVESLAAIPSVVYGLWGIFVLGPWLKTSVDPLLTRYFGFLPLFRGQITPVSMLTASLVLAVMVIPSIASVCTDVFRAVPREQREAALALGATRWETFRLAVLSFGFSGIIGGILLGLGRALGETIAVAMAIGNRAEINVSLLSPSSTLASVIANEFAEASSDMHISALIELGLVLLILTVILNAIARTLVLLNTNRYFSKARG